MLEIKDASKSRVILMMVALCLSSMCTLGDLVVTPIAANLFVVFADAPEWLINLGITGPALVGLPFCFLAGWMADRMDKKLLMVIGFAIFTVSSICGAMITNIVYFVTLRCLATGVGWGITNSCALAMIADAFPNEVMHGKMVGVYNMVMSLMGALLSAVAGIAAAGAADMVSGMHFAFYTYWIALPILIMLIVFVPRFPAKIAKGQVADDENKVVEVPKGWWKRLPMLNVQIFFVAICYFAMFYMLSLYIMDAGVGDEAFIGSMASVMTIATAIGSLVFGFIYKKLRNAVYLPSLFIMGIGILVLAFVPNPVVVTIVLALMGFFWPLYFCYFYTYATEIVPPSKSGTATGIVALSDGLAAALCSYALTGFMAIMGTTSSMPVWPIFGIVMLVVAVISTIWYFLVGRKKKTWNEEHGVSEDAPEVAETTEAADTPEAK